MKILLVEDDVQLRKHISKTLQGEGYEVIESGDGEDGLFHITSNTSDLVILDRMLPGLDGLSMLRKVRQQGVTTPVLMLTALNAIGDKVAGLDAGADDYLAKPFDIRELLARVRALVRRPGSIEDGSVIEFGDLEYIVTTFILKGPSGETHLTKKLGAMMELFMRETNAALTRSTLFNRIWGPESEVNEGNIDSFIMLLRRRLQLVGSKIKIENKRGIGYFLAFNAESE